MPGGEPPGSVSAGRPRLIGGGEGKRWPAGRIRPVGFSAVSRAGRSRGRWRARALSVTVTHQVDRGLRAAAAARSRARSGSIGPMPPSSPGRSARPVTVASGMVRVTCPANPGGITPASGPPPGRAGEGSGRLGAGRRAVCGWPEGPGVHAEQYVQEGPGPQRIHAAVQPGLAQLLGPRGDPLVGGQHLRGRQFPPGQPRVPRSLGPPLHPGLLRRVLPALLRLIRRDLHDRPGDRGPQPGRGQRPGLAQHHAPPRPGPPPGPAAPSPPR